MVTASTIERQQTAARDPVSGWSDTTRRRIIIHYHILKNAGTSLDDTLKEAFESRWINVESRFGHRLAPARLARHIRDRGDGIVFSSHTAAFPVPEIDNASILPVVFVRHPIDRISSIYSFERRQTPVRTLGAFMAKMLPFKGYVRWRLHYDTLISGFQVDRLSQGSAQPGTLRGALDYLERLPFVGVVEHFEASLKILEGYLRIAFPRAALRAMHVNAQPERDASLQGRLLATRKALGDSLYEKLVELNREDLILYGATCRRMGLSAHNVGSA